jgi:hypothetical protein
MVKVSVFAGAEKGDGPDGIIGDLNITLQQKVPGLYATPVYELGGHELHVGHR